MKQTKKLTPTAEIVREYSSLLENYSEASSARLNDLQDKYDFFNTIYKEGSKEGVKDCLGNILVPAQFDKIENCWTYMLRNNPVIVKNGNKYGIVSSDGTGKIIFPIEYTAVKDITAPFYALQNAEGKWGLIDYNGKVRIPFVQDSIFKDSNDGYVFFERDGKTGIYCYRYDLCTDAIFDSIIEACYGECLQVEMDGRPGKVTVEGKFIADEDYENLSEEEQEDIDFINAD